VCDQDKREQERIVAAQDTEGLGPTGQQLQRVGVDPADSPLDADDVVGGGQFQQRGATEAAGGPVRDVVDDQHHRRAFRDGLEVRDDRGLRRPHVIGHNGQ